MKNVSGKGETREKGGKKYNCWADKPSSKHKTCSSFSTRSEIHEKRISAKKRKFSSTLNLELYPVEYSCALFHRVNPVANSIAEQLFFTELVDLVTHVDREVFCDAELPGPASQPPDVGAFPAYIFHGLIQNS